MFQAMLAEMIGVDTVKKMLAEVEGTPFGTLTPATSTSAGKTEAAKWSRRSRSGFH